MKKTLKKGFTLVELVIVIAVIAILSAVLIPTFGNVINNAKESSARSEASNAITQYVNNQASNQQDTNIADGYVIVLEKRYTFTSTTSLTSFEKGKAIVENGIKVGYIFECTKGAVGDEVKEAIASGDNGKMVGIKYKTSDANVDMALGEFAFDLTSAEKSISSYGVYFLDANFETNGISAKVIVVAKK